MSDQTLFVEFSEALSIKNHTSEIHDITKTINSKQNKSVKLCKNPQVIEKKTSIMQRLPDSR